MYEGAEVLECCVRRKSTTDPQNIRNGSWTSKGRKWSICWLRVILPYWEISDPNENMCSSIPYIVGGHDFLTGPDVVDRAPTARCLIYYDLLFVPCVIHLTGSCFK